VEVTERVLVYTALWVCVKYNAARVGSDPEKGCLRDNVACGMRLQIETESPMHSGGQNSGRCFRRHPEIAV